ncbi:O-antigen ligase family protein [Serratia liquefaciens]|uniref:O-antigen ligase family protein n=1 Tax=Serratia liquefaciens TaxID=614 RepID=UPI00236001B9|nr:O-antigen ligase family protein [Serratia liquefaciens]
MSHSNLYSQVNVLIAVLSVFGVISFSLFCSESMAGKGLTLVINVIVTGLVAASVFFIFITRVISTRGYFIFTSTPASRLLLLATVVLSVPLLYTQPQWLNEAVWRIVGLALGVGFFFCCLQMRSTHRMVYGVICVLLLLVCVQALVAVLQLFVPAWSWVPLYGRRVYGTFLQPNVLASFIATGLALSLMLFLLPGFALAQTCHERYRQRALVLMLALFSALLVLIQSRAGWLGGIVVALLFLWRFGALSSKRSLWATSAILLGALTGIGLLLFADTATSAINHDHSNLARLSMLRDTLAMIADKPWSGWGYGGFEYSFQHFRINQTPPTAVTEIARHPHNEILLWISEGGVVALVGILLLSAAGLRVVLQVWRYDQNAFAGKARPLAGVPTALCIALLPMLTHTQLEYPFYLSTLHFVVFLLLLAMADRLSGGVTVRKVFSSTCSALLAGTVAACTLVVAIVAGFALKGNLAIAQVERFRMVDITPIKTLPALSTWVHRERVMFNEQVHGLLAYNHTRDERQLEAYSQWAQRYLTRRIDKNVYASLIMILQHQEQDFAAEHYRRDAARLFPTDVRFHEAAVENTVHEAAPGNDEVSP